MIMKKEKFTTYKFYTDKKQRLAIFGEDLGDGNVQVCIIKCAKGDFFSKETARLAHDIGIVYSERVIRSSKDDKIYIKEQTFQRVSKEIVIVPIKEGDSAKYTFLQYCRDNFYRRVRVEVVEVVDAICDKNGKVKFI